MEEGCKIGVIRWGVSAPLPFVLQAEKTVSAEDDGNCALPEVRILIEVEFVLPPCGPGGYVAFRIAHAAIAAGLSQRVKCSSRGW